MSEWRGGARKPLSRASELAAGDRRGSTSRQIIYCVFCTIRNLRTIDCAIIDYALIRYHFTDQLMSISDCWCICGRLGSFGHEHPHAH